MIKNYFKIGLRCFTKQKIFSIINICGLTLGISCFMLIGLYVCHEFSFDRFFKRKENIYRIVTCFSPDVLGFQYAPVTPGPLAKALKDNFPEVRYAACVDKKLSQKTLISYKDKGFYETGIWADGDFLKIFSFEILKGEGAPSLNRPNTILITDDLANKLFGDEEAIGKLISVDDQQNLIVSGILKNVPDNSHLQFDFIISFCTIATTPRGKRRIERWTSHLYFTYFELVSGTDQQDFESKLSVFTDKLKNIPGNMTERYTIQSLRNIHLKSPFQYDLADTTDIRYVYLFMGIAFCILMIACVNCINLLTAKSDRRVKEIGMRKVMGAYRSQVFNQFIGEAFIQTIAALLLSISIVKLALPVFNSFTGKNLVFSITQNWIYLLSLAGILLLVGLLSGTYPALYLSSLKPVKILKGETANSIGGSRLIKVLIVGQFSITVLLAFSASVIFRQLHYIKNKETGYRKEHIVVVPVRDRGIQKYYSIIKSELVQNSDILEVCVSSHLPSDIGVRETSVVEDRNGADIKYDALVYRGIVDYDFLDVFGINLIKGRNFSKEYPSDSEQACIVNETVVEQMGWDEPLGKRFSIWGRDARVIGVFQNFHFRSLHYAMEPLALHLSDQASLRRYLSIRIRPENRERALQFIQETYLKYREKHPFEYFFFDDQFNKMYKSEQNLGTIIGFFSVLGFFIASLGLLGLSVYSATRRTKEIGIRKVFGASTFNIVISLSKDFAKWVLLANAIAFPVSFYFMNKWLQNFAYKTNINIWLFLIIAVISGGIAWLSVSFQTLKSATADPVETLRYE